jgi:hypothetical protein
MSVKDGYAHDLLDNTVYHSLKYLYVTRSCTDLPNPKYVPNLKRIFFIQTLNKFDFLCYKKLKNIKYISCGTVNLPDSYKVPNLRQIHTIDTIVIFNDIYEKLNTIIYEYKSGTLPNTKYVPNLKKLHVHKFTSIPYYNNLEELLCTNTDGSNEGTIYFQQFPKLKKLSCHRITNTIIKNLPMLEYLDCSSCSSVQFIELDNLRTLICSKCPNLKIIKCRNLEKLCYSFKTTLNWSMCNVLKLKLLNDGSKRYYNSNQITSLPPTECCPSLKSIKTYFKKRPVYTVLDKQGLIINLFLKGYIRERYIILELFHRPSNPMSHINYGIGIFHTNTNILRLMSGMGIVFN